MGSCCSQDGVYDIHPLDSNLYPTHRPPDNNLNYPNDSFNLPSKMSLSLTTSSSIPSTTSIQPPAWLFANRSNRLARRNERNCASECGSDDPIFEEGFSIKTSQDLSNSFESSFAPNEVNLSKEVKPVCKPRRGLKISPVHISIKECNTSMKLFSSPRLGAELKDHKDGSLVGSNASSFGSRLERPLTPAKSILKTQSTEIKGSDSVQNFLSNSRSTAGTLLENIADATKGFFNPYRDKRSHARQRTLKRVHKWWEEDLTKLEKVKPSLTLTVVPSQERGASAPTRPRRAVQFEIDNSKSSICHWPPFRSCSFDDGHPQTIIVTTTSSNRSTPIKNLIDSRLLMNEGLSTDQADWDDEDEEDQLHIDDLDEEEDVEEIQERKVQWHRAQRYIVALNKLKKFDRLPRAFSDPEIFSSESSESRRIKRDNFTLV